MRKTVQPPKETRMRAMVASIAGLALASGGAAWGQDVAPPPPPAKPVPDVDIGPPVEPVPPEPTPQELPAEPEGPDLPAEPELTPPADEVVMDPLDPSHMDRDTGPPLTDEADVDSPDGPVAPVGPEPGEVL